MRLFICEKPSQAEGIAKVLGNARKGSTCWETSGGRVTWCYGHMLELMEPEDYDRKYAGDWSFNALPIIPEQHRYVPNRPKDWMKPDTKAFVRRSNEQLKAIGALLKDCNEVVIATDPDRQGEAIARNVLQHFGYRNKNSIKRLWLSSADEASVRKALARLKANEDTENLHWVARCLSIADWLIGMNATRGVTKKIGGKGVVSIGRVQTPTAALVVRRDREIANFKPRDYFELIADITAASGVKVALKHSPADEAKRIWDRKQADAIATAASGRAVTLAFSEERKSKSPPKLFSLAALQKAANRKWDWSAKHTLDVAQELYETHKAASYPRTNCEFLPDEQRDDVGAITRNLTALDVFKHLRGQAFEPRKSVFNSAKVEAHHAIIPTTIEPPLDRMDADEKKLFLLIASRYLASLLPDYEYLASKISTNIDDREFSTSGNVPLKPGFKIVAGADDDEDEQAKLPLIKDGEGGNVMACTVEGKKTKPPAHYTEASLIDDMENIAKYVTDPAQKALLKSTEGKVGSADKGIGTSATRGDIIDTIKKRELVTMKGKSIIATDKGNKLISYLEKELPALADPGETAVWEERLSLVAEGKLSEAEFVQEMNERVRALIAILARMPDAPSANGSGPATGTGVTVNAVEIIDHGDYYVANGAFTGRIYKNKCGHKLTPQEVVELVAGGKITLTEARTKSGLPFKTPPTATYNPNKKPYPDVEIDFGQPEGSATGVESPKKGGGAIKDCGAYYAVPGVLNGAFPVKFFKTFAGRDITAEELAAIIAAGDKGYTLNGFVSKDTGRVSSGTVRFNKKKKPFPGYEFVN